MSTPARLDLGARQSARRDVVRAQLEQLLPPAPFPVHVGYGPLPPGWREVESWRVFPCRSAPRYLLPVDPASARRVVLAHNGLRSPRVAAARRLAALALGPLAVVRGRRDVLRVGVPRDVTEAVVEQTLITAQLRGRVPGAVATAVSLRDFHPRAKPTVHLLDASGRVLAFAKVASDPATAQRVLDEARLMRQLGPPLARRAAGSGSRVRVPRVLDSGRCASFAFSIVEPLPLRARRVRAGDEPQVLRALTAFSAALDRSDREIPGHPPAVDSPPRVTALGETAVGETVLGETALWHAVRERVAAARAAREVRPDLVAALDRLADAAQAVDGGTSMRVGCYHGDWVPWNMGWADDAHGEPVLWVWDLEYGATVGPLGLDGLRWVFQQHHVQGGSTFGQAVAEMTAAAPRVLPALGVDPAVTDALVRLHVVETVATALGLLAGGRGLPRGLDPDAVEVMRSLTPDP